MKKERYLSIHFVRTDQPMEDTLLNKAPAFFSIMPLHYRNYLQIFVYGSVAISLALREYYQDWVHPTIGCYHLTGTFLLQYRQIPLHRSLHSPMAMLLPMQL